MVLNAAASLVVGAGKFKHITPVLRDVLHWLPVRQRILYKVAVTAFDYVRATGPAYFRDVCVPAAEISGRAHLHLAKCCDMLVPRSRTQFDQRSFHVAAHVVWNSLPTHLRSISVSREQFRDGLKTHLFTQDYAFFWELLFKSVYEIDIDKPTSYVSSSSVVSRAFYAACAYSTFGHHPRSSPLATFVPNFVSVVTSVAELTMEKNHVLNPSITHSITHPAYVMPREPKLLLWNNYISR